MISAFPRQYVQIADSVPSHTITVCHRLLRTERAALESYDRILVRNHSLTLQALHTIRDQHVEAIASLEENIFTLGGAPEIFPDSPEGVIPTGVTAVLTAVYALEELCEREYGIALRDFDLQTETRQLVRRNLLPRIEQHLAIIRQLRSLPNASHH